MEELKNEVSDLRGQVKALRLIVLATMATFVIVSISFQVQYSQIRSYYQSTVQSNQEILLNQKWQNSEIQRSLSMIQELLPD
ncbi:hypothetical protein AALH30_14115 [Blautia pseudococcoides]|uniref:hypothetical protein n=1 Tax=Blautia pseudococcoides TaxID=1796616 RepID=UPI00148B1794|nr:hypothetical protein [Blautia pseudococcoides]QJU15782.1 hypothetical protein HL650_15885 [Blautia pseudococcoides]